MEQTASPSALDAEDPLEVMAPFGRLVHLTSFIGREHEIAWVRGRLESGQRLLTITGPGGVGKTRLAMAVAGSIDTRAVFTDGVVVVEMAPVADQTLVLPTIARALGVVAEDQRTPVQRLAAAIDCRRMLLVLDNLEHVIGASVELWELLDSCPNIAMLVTSRRALRLSGEQEFALAPLPVVTSGDGRSLDALARTPAIALFVDRATAANPAFSLTSENAEAVIEICTRLDGLPLAIELAAARVKILSPQALAARLTGRLQLLTSGPRDAPQRQQTLRQTIGWSYDLLTPYEQLLFRRLSVFAGGASLDAIEAVAGYGSPFSQLDILDGIAALVDQSLLVREESADGEPRFRMLETIREFALEGLESAGEDTAIRDAHADFFTGRAEASAANEYGAEESARIQQLEPDLDNVRGALTWLLVDQEHGTQRAHLGMRLAGAMVRFWDVRGYLQEEEEWLSRALSLVPERHTRERATALTALGVNAWFTSRLDDAIAWQQKALESWRELDDRAAIVRSLWFLGLVAGKRREVERLHELYEESAPLAPRLGITLWAMVPNSLLALAALAEGDGQRSIKLLAETLDYHETHGYFWPRAWVLGLMAESAMLASDRRQALDYHQQSLALFSDHGDIYATLDGLTAVAVHATAFGDAEAAACLLGAVSRMRASVGNRMTWYTVGDQEAIDMVRSALGDDRFALVQEQSCSLQVSEAVALALAVRPEAARNAATTGGDAYGLSPRELEVLRCLTEGMGNQEIGEKLFISTRTAGTHVSNILGKLGVHSRSAAVSLALNEGLV
jgi:predicted ATPase/DNA-binding CsgD family transcriptional regulator